MTVYSAARPQIGRVRAYFLRRKLHTQLDVKTEVILRSLRLTPGEASLNRKIQNAAPRKALTEHLLKTAEVQGFFTWHGSELAQLGVGLQDTRTWVTRSIIRVHRRALDQRDMLTPTRVV